MEREGLFIERMAGSTTSAADIEFAPKWDSKWNPFTRRLAEQCIRLQDRVAALEKEADAAWNLQRAAMDRERTEMEERYREETEAQTRKIESLKDRLASIGRERQANLRRENRNREAYERRIAVLESENARLKKEITAFRLVL